MSPFEKELLKVLKNIEKELHIMNRKEQPAGEISTPIIPNPNFFPNFMTHPLTSEGVTESANRSR